MDLHDFFQNRAGNARDPDEPDRDYNEFLGYFKEALMKLPLEEGDIPESDMGTEASMESQAMLFFRKGQEDGEPRANGELKRKRPASYQGGGNLVTPRRSKRFHTGTLVAKRRKK